MLLMPEKLLLSSEEICNNVEVSNEIFYDVFAELDPEGINLNFRKYYESFVFCSKEQLKKIDQKVDVIIFTGYAGAGHFAPSRALAKKYESYGKTVIIVDILQMVWPIFSAMNCYSWLYVSRHNQDLFLKVSEKVGTEKGSDKFLGMYKHMNIDFLTDFIKEKQVKVCISTYLSANAIASKIAKQVNMFGVLVPDACAIGMACEIYKNTENIVYFTVNEETIADAKARYPYHMNTKNFEVIGAVPSFMGSKHEMDGYTKNTLTWFVGGGMGIGYGIDALDVIINAHEGPKVIVCGNNKSWYKKVCEARKMYPDKNIHPLLYVTPENVKTLMLASKIVIGKPGGSTLAEFVAMDGYKIFYGTIKGHEELNAKYCEVNGIARWCRNLYVLEDEILDPVYTDSIYTKGIITKNPADVMVQYTMKHF